MAKVIWSKLALEDLKSIFEYISKDSIKYAGLQIETIIERVGQLEIFPESGRIVPEFNNELIREIIEENYRIVYRLKTKELVEIARIHHSSRLLPNI